MLLGCIADDFTGATDLANTLTRQGMRTVQTIGIPDTEPGDIDAVVVALKSRTISPNEAIAQSITACRWLKSHGAKQIFFKYCSTFDSTDEGNIGPVADALLAELGESITTICPAFPENGRTIYMGHLFVGNTLLSHSSMRNHPLTPMTDSNLVAVLARQSRHNIGNIAHSTVKQGGEAILAALNNLRLLGTGHAVVDAIDNADLFALGDACSSLKLVTGGSGAALGLPENFRRQGLLEARAVAPVLPQFGGRGVVLSGSCSSATLGQVHAFEKSHVARALDGQRLMSHREAEIADIVTWVMLQLADKPALVYATATPDDVVFMQNRHGRDNIGMAIEKAMGEIALRLADKGVRRFVVAGGETSGAVTQALGVSALDIGPQIAPGVPATASRGPRCFGLVLKSGNFGGPDFFTEALEAIP